MTADTARPAPGVTCTTCSTARAAPVRWNAEAARTAAPTSSTRPPDPSSNPPTMCRIVVFLTTQIFTDVTMRLPLNPHAQVGSLLLDVDPPPLADAVADPAEVGQFPELTHPATVAALLTRWL